jgi:hypothetical protein
MSFHANFFSGNAVQPLIKHFLVGGLQVISAEQCLYVDMSGSEFMSVVRSFSFTPLSF